MANKSKGGGPKTNNGKAISSRNSITHGLTAKRWINDDEQSLLDATVEALSKDFDPQTSIEKILISKLAECSVRLARIQRVEDAMFDLASSEAAHPETSIKSLNHNSAELTQTVYDTSTAYYQYDPVNATRKFNMLDEIDRQNISDVSGWNYIENNMPDIVQYIIEQCSNEKLALPDFINRETDQNGNLGIKITIIGAGESSEETRLSTEEVLKNSHEISASSLQQYLEQLSRNLGSDIQAQMTLNNVEKRSHQIKGAAIPDIQKLGLIQRYRTADERLFSKSLGELIALQDRRKASN